MRRPSCERQGGVPYKRDISEAVEDVYGDKINIKSNKFIRIGYQNIRGFPLHSNKVKLMEWQSTINDFNFDIAGFTETNTDWRFIQHQHGPRQVAKDWWKTFTINKVNNKNEHIG